MSRVEVESFIKSFTLFFSSLGLLIGTLFYLNYTKDIKTLDDTLFSQMRLCSYDLKCTDFSIDFLPEQQQVRYTLHKDADGLNSYFPIPNSNDFVMQIHLDQQKYHASLKRLQYDALWKFSGTLLIVALLSFLFSLYALYPLRNALSLTQEFIKDILHDFNTPLGALRLNSAMLKKEIGENSKIARIEQSVQNVLDLQENLRAYLHDHERQQEVFELHSIAQERVALLEKAYPQLNFKINIDSVTLESNLPAFRRILDNILTNACKYNTPKGSVTLTYDLQQQRLHIIDTAKGIKNPKRIFERFYKEQERGIGIGLHIVKKLCDELKINISVESKINSGTDFSLNLKNLLKW